MAEFPLLPIPNPGTDRRPRGQGGRDNLRLPDRARQGERLRPVFRRLPNVLQDRRDPVTLRVESAGTAPEGAVALDPAGTLADFYRVAPTSRLSNFSAKPAVASANSMMHHSQPNPLTSPH